MTSSFVRLQSYLWNFDRGNGLFGLPQEVTALADEPGICLVTFGFTVTHGMDQIWLSAEVTV